jgi:uncharacterized surface protein with fasciclin (FAS1) repeats
MKNLVAAILTVGLLANVASAHCGACGTEKPHQHAEEAPAKVKVEKKTIIETAQAAGSFKTLLAAVEAAGLVDALSGKGPLTVFAPTDEAFAALPEGTVEALLEDPSKLASILSYHVVDGEVTAKMVVGLEEAKTLNGQSVTVNIKEDAVMIDKAKVVTTDIMCSNGVIHVIDAVMIPKAPKVKS